MSLVLSKTGEVADFLDADQFQWAQGHPLTQFACGFFAVAICRAMAMVGKPPTQSVQQVIQEALAWYVQYNGSDALSNTAGMSDGQLYQLLHQVSLHYQATTPDIAVVKQWVKCFYPVILAVEETAVRDLALGDRSPYPWRPAGNHIIVVTGCRADGNLLVRDSANCTNLYDPNSLRPGPRVYDARALSAPGAIVSATVVVPGIPNWLPRPASAMPPAAAPAPLLPAPVAPAAASAFSKEDMQVWGLLAGKLYPEPLPTTTGIAQAWRAARTKGMEMGPPLGPEFVSADEQDISLMCFPGGIARWSHVSHSCSWHDGRGAIPLP